MTGQLKSTETQHGDSVKEERQHRPSLHLTLAAEEGEAEDTKETTAQEPQDNTTQRQSRDNTTLRTSTIVLKQKICFKFLLLINTPSFPTQATNQ